MIVLLLLVGFGVAGVAVVAITLVPGFFESGSGARRWTRVAGAVLAIPVLLIACTVLILRFTIFKETPSLSELERKFPVEKADLDTLIRMSDEDGTFSRIAPTFVDRAPDTADGFGRFMDGDPKAGLPQPRWKAYRTLFSRNGIELGIQRDKWGDAFIMVDSVGLLNRGHASGYLHCRPTDEANDDRFEPCVLRTESGRRNYDPQNGGEAYSFQRIGNNWYAYDQGPS
jgi:hypothetical protein